MKKKQKYLFAALIAIALLLFFSCGASSKVPNGTIEIFVQDSRYYDSDRDCSWDASHLVDRASHTDSVDIVLSVPYKYGTEEYSCTAAFIYDRSADLWTLSNDPDWDFIRYKFNSKIKTRLEFDDFSDQYCLIDIKKISNDKITLDYVYWEDVFTPYIGTRRCMVEGSGTFELDRLGGVDIPITLPGNFYINSGSKKTTLRICLDVQKGIRLCYVGASYENIVYRQD